MRDRVNIPRPPFVVLLQLLLLGFPEGWWRREIALGDSVNLPRQPPFVVLLLLLLGFPEGWWWREIALGAMRPIICKW
jgi:hypothetical protein